MTDFDEEEFDVLRAAAMERIYAAFDLSPQERELVEEMAAHAQRAREIIDKERERFLAEILDHVDEVCERISTELSTAMRIPITVTYDRGPLL